MRIIKILLENFRQFKGKSEFQLTPGFNLIQGPNGSGKSNILYAIYFGLYKGTAKGMVAADDLISFGEQYMAVTLEFEHQGKRFQIYRNIDRKNKEDYKYEEWSTKTGTYLPLLTGKSSKTSIKERVEKDTGIRQMVFENIVFAQQKTYYEIVRGNKDFMDNALHVLPLTFLKGTVHDLIPKKSELEKNQQLYTQAEANIGQHQQFIVTQQGLKTKIEADQGQLRTDKTKLNDDDKKYRDLRKEVLSFTGEINRMIGYDNKGHYARQEMERYEQEKQEYISQEGDLGALEGKVNAATNSLEGLKKNIEAQDLELQQKKEANGRIEAELKEKEKLIKNLKGLEGEPLCPVCRQKVTPEHLKGEVDKISKELQTKKEEKEHHTADLQKAQQTLQELKSRKDALDVALKDLGKKVDKLKNFDDSIAQKQTEQREAKKNLSSVLKTFAPPFNKTLTAYNALFNDSLAINTTPSVAFIDDAYQKMSNLIEKNQEEYDGKLKGLDERLESFETHLKNISQTITTAEQNIHQAQTKIKDIKFEVLMVNKRTLLDEVLGNLVQEFREKKVAQLNEYTLEWYNRLISVPLFRDIWIDKENYHVYVLPLPNVVEKDDYKDIIKYASGGHETFIAIAERLALLEIFNTSFGMFDEITDNADRDNATNMIQELAHSGEYLDQVIAVTHFEVGREVAGNIVRIRPILDSEGKPTGWSEIES